MSKSAAARSVFAGLFLAWTALAQCPPPGGYAPPAPPPDNPPVSGPSGSPSPGGPSVPKPTGPSTPGPGAPSAPKPTSNPTTPPRAPATNPTTPRGIGPRTGGMPISLERGATSKDRLRVDWLHPVPPERAQVGTASVGPLPKDEALAALWSEDDERPLLVLRECQLCAGSDGALLSRSLVNDKTMLMTKWFRTVKLPAHVAESGHPFFNVFGGFGFADGWPHFFLLAHPGAEPVAFTGQQVQSQLWKGMFDVLGQRYAKDPQKAVRKWLAVLDRYDTIDAREQDLKEELLEVRAERGPESAKAKKLETALEALAKERADVEAEEAQVRDLGLLKLPSKKVAAAK